MPSPSDPSRPSGSSRLDAIEALVAECLDRIPAEGQQAVTDVCRENPDYASDVLRHLELLGEVGLITDDPLENHGAFPERLGDFRLVRRLGGGGMGVVYLAHDESLDRHVALKLIRPEYVLTRQARIRFNREVQAVARLQHPNIVPVYQVGEQGGIPYFSMEYLRGCSLGEVIAHARGRPPESLSAKDLGDGLASVLSERDEAAAPTGALFTGSWSEACLRIATEIAHALDHAHSRGVIHRDVKPSNIMLTEDGRVSIVDFGLAQAEGASELTRPGTTLGSIAYVSPEHLRGEPLDARTDIYSLGVTLYEMLTLRQPFVAATEDDTRRRIASGERPPLRRLSRSVPTDLETVCATAMEVDAARRYGAAQDLARDLEHVAARRPIQACRPSAALRVQRWIQRHPTATVALVLGFLLVVVGPLVFAWRERAARLTIDAERKTAIDERAEAEKQRAAADVARKEAEAATGVAERARADAVARARTASEVVRFLENLFREATPVHARGRDVTVRTMLERGVRRVRMLADEPRAQIPLLVSLGRAMHALGDVETSARMLERAQKLQEARFPDENYEYAQVLKALSVVRHSQSRLPDAEDLLVDALDRLDREPDTPDIELLRAGCLNDLCGIRMARRNVGGANDAIAESLEIFRDCAAAPVHIGNALANQANVRVFQKRHPEAITLANEALEIFPADEESPHPQRATLLHVLATAEIAAGQPRSARRHLLEAMTIFDQCFDPNHPKVAGCHYSLGALYRQYRNESVPIPDLAVKAERHLRTAHEIYTECYQAAHRDRARATAELAGLLVDTAGTDAARWSEAKSLLQASEPVLARALGPNAFTTALVRCDVARCLAHERKFEEAIAMTRRSVRAIETIAPNAEPLAIAQERIGYWSRTLGKTADAERALTRALERWTARHGATFHGNAALLFALAMLAEGRGAHDDAVRLMRRSIVVHRRWWPDSARTGYAESKLGAMLSRLGSSEAERLLRAGHTRVAASRPADHAWTRETRAALDKHLAAEGKTPAKPTRPPR